MKKVRKDSQALDELSLKNEILGLFFLIFSVLVLFSLFNYSPNDPSWFASISNKNVVIQNYCGRIGAYLSAIFFNLFGYSSYVIALFLLFITSYYFYNKNIKNIVTKSMGYLLMLISLSALISNLNSMSLLDGKEVKSGGIFGFFVNEFFQGEVKQFFSFIIFFTLMIVSLVLIAKLSIRNIAKFAWKLILLGLKKGQDFFNQQIEKYKRYKSIKKVRDKYKSELPTSTDEDPDTKVFKAKKKIIRQPSKIPEESHLFSNLKKEIQVKSKHSLPPLTYLDAPTEREKIDFSELEEKKKELAQRLEEFRIRGQIMEYTPGPVITTYEFVPDVGVKVRDVTNLSEDLALVAKAQYVRIERILGKKAIGIEIPNKKREVINLREILSSEEFKQCHSPISLALGKTKSGEIFITDLQEMPHIIIAGATGSGKSVAIHTIILSILYKASSEEVKFILIDPKRVELAIYNSLPHLLTPVVVSTKLAKNALDWVVFEMEVRYKKLFMLQVRNIEQYNKKLELMVQSGDETLEKLESQEKLPYIVVIIDEFADLMMESGREIEDNVAKLAHKARAVGIHLVLATQRPSIDVITGTIKNNFPSRIALAVPSKHDSRTIIDVVGAEKLLGHGDMLFMPPKTASLIRLHCAFVSEEEALRVVNYLSQQKKPRFNTQIVKPKVKKEDTIENGQLDPIFFDAAKIIITTGQASASFLQRKMSVGYARAGRLIDQLEIKGVISTPSSKNERKILMSMGQIEDMETDDE